MRQWRVGTLSMGLLLVGTGVGLLWSQFQPATAVAAVLRWWPLLFVVLGLEVLAYAWGRKDQDGLVKYDVFSILIIVLLVFTGLGLKVFQDAGLGQYVQEQVESSNYNISLAGHEIALGEEVQKLVVTGSSCRQLDIRTVESPNLVVGGDLQLRAKTREEAASRAAQSFTPRTRQAGDTVFLNMNGSGDMEARLMIPDRLAVEIDAGGQDLSLQANRINQDWLLRDVGSGDLILPAGADLTLTVMGNTPLQLNGNIQWTRETSPAGDEEQGGSQEFRGGDEKYENQPAGSCYTARAQLGSGSHHLTLLSANGPVTISRLP